MPGPASTSPQTPQQPVPPAEGDRSAPSLGLPFRPIVLPSPPLSFVPGPEVTQLNPSQVQHAITTWCLATPIGSSSADTERRIGLTPTGFDFLSPRAQISLGPDRATVQSQGFVHAVWGDGYVPSAIRQFLPSPAPDRSRDERFAGEARIWSENFLATVTGSGTDGVAGALVVPHAASLFGSYSNGRWASVGEFRIENRDHPLSGLHGAFAASNDRQHLRFGIVRPGVEFTPELRTGDLLSGFELYRGAEYPQGAVAGWFGGPQSQLSFRYDIGRDRFDAAGSCHFVEVPTRVGLVSLESGFDTRDRTASIGAQLTGDQSGGVFHRNALFRFGLNPQGSWGLTLSALLEY